jgi:hypothetical protein
MFFRYLSGSFGKLSENIETKFRQNTRIDNRKDKITIKTLGKYQQTLDSLGIINPEKCIIVPEKLFCLSGKIENSAGKINDVTGKITISPN